LFLKSKMEWPAFLHMGCAVAFPEKLRSPFGRVLQTRIAGDCETMIFSSSGTIGRLAFLAHGLLFCLSGPLMLAVIGIIGRLGTGPIGNGQDGTLWPPGAAAFIGKYLAWTYTGYAPAILFLLVTPAGCGSIMRATSNGRAPSASRSTVPGRCRSTL
jgi:hypothetical protein